MRIRDIVTRDVQVVQSGDTIRRAAQPMDNRNVGALPVCDGQRLVGVQTDRNVAMRATSAGLTPDRCRVSAAMTAGPHYRYEDDPVAEVTRMMGGQQIRRVPAVDRNDRLTGIVSHGDPPPVPETTVPPATRWSGFPPPPSPTAVERREG